MAEKSTKRIWEIDFIRGIAILGMIVIHVLFVLPTFFNITIFEKGSVAKIITDFVQNYGGLIFIFISGIAAILSRNNLRRGLQLFFLAMCVTYITLIYNTIANDGNNYTVRFGILHSLSFCMMAAPFFLKLPDYIERLFENKPDSRKTAFIISLSLSFLIALSVILIGNYCRTNDINIPVFCGYEIRDWFRSSDYFPVFPYWGYYILGTVFGQIVYKNKQSLFKSEKIANNFIIRFFSFCGRHTLLIYLAHQPIIFGIIFLLK